MNVMLVAVGPNKELRRISTYGTLWVVKLNEVKILPTCLPACRRPPRELTLQYILQAASAAPFRFPLTTDPPAATTQGTRSTLRVVRQAKLQRIAPTGSIYTPACRVPSPPKSLRGTYLNLS